MWSGTIKEDGAIVLDGCVPSATSCVGINGKFIAIHHPGGSWWDNSGKNYTAAWIDIHELESLRPGNEPGTWRFELKRLGHGMSFHPTRKEAKRNAAFKLRNEGEKLCRQIEERNSRETD